MAPLQVMRVTLEQSGEPLVQGLYGTTRCGGGRGSGW